MNNFKQGDIIRWYFNSEQYIIGTIVEECNNGTILVEHSNGQQRNYKEKELVLHN